MTIMSAKAPTKRESTSYDQDFYAWTQESAAKLRAGELAGLDWEHIAEELEDMGKRDKRKVLGHLKILIQHLLKWEAQPDLRTRSASWKLTIRTQRDQIADLLADSPSLTTKLTPEAINKAFKRAVDDAMDETGLTRECFPPVCPYDTDQLLSDYWPA